MLYTHMQIPLKFNRLMGC